MISSVKTFLKILTRLLIGALPGSPFRVLRNYLWRLIGFNVSTTANIMSSAELICGDISIGSDSFIGDEVFITGGFVRIGARCDIAPRVVIHAGSHNIGIADRRAGAPFFGRIEIGDGTWIGTNSTIIHGAIIGSGCVIGAGSVVTAGKYPDNSLVVGNPAVVKKHEFKITK